MLLNCKTALPFNEVDDYEFMNINCNEDVEVCSNVNSSLNDNLPYMCYDYSEYKSSDFEKRVDPNNNFFNTARTKCAYYPENNCIPGAKRGYYGFIIVHVSRDFLLATYSPHFFPDLFHIWQMA